MTPRKLFLLVTLVVMVAAVDLSIYSRPMPQAQKAAALVGKPVNIKPPLGLPPVPVPADNLPTAETIALGRRLYYDPILSVDNTVACASCHTPLFGFTDAKQFSEGVKGKKGNRNAPTVINAAYYTTQFWDGRAPSLEKQAEGPVQNPVEMANTLEGAVKKLTGDASYRAAFEKAFGPGPIKYEMVEKAIASFERTVISGNSAFDRYFYGGDKSALSASARRGLEVFAIRRRATARPATRSARSTLCSPTTSSTTSASGRIREASWPTLGDTTSPRTKRTRAPSRRQRCATSPRRLRTCMTAV